MILDRNDPEFSMANNRFYQKNQNLELMDKSERQIIKK